MWNLADKGIIYFNNVSAGIPAHFIKQRILSPLTSNTFIFFTYLIIVSTGTYFKVFLFCFSDPFQ